MDNPDPGVTVATSEFENIESGAMICDEELALIERFLPAIIEEMLRDGVDAEG